MVDHKSVSRIYFQQKGIGSMKGRPTFCSPCFTVGKVEGVETINFTWVVNQNKDRPGFSGYAGRFMEDQLRCR